MAVGFSAVGVGASDWGNFDTAVGDGFDLSVNNGDCIVAGLVFSAADLQILFYHDDNDITDLTRTVTYGGVPMTPLGPPVQWDTMQAWTEVFALMGVPEGKQRLAGKVSGGASSKRLMRVSATTYSGVESIGTPVAGSGTGTSMSISSTAAPADRLVGVFGSRSGISAVPGQRYLDNSVIGLGIGDVAGTGSPQAVAATRQKAGQWGGLLVPLYAADTIATCKPIPFDVGFGELTAHREPRLGGLRRQVFEVPLESFAEFVDLADPKTPEDITPLTLDWTAFLAVTKDRIKDCVIDAGGLDVKDDWFTYTDTTVMVGGGSADRGEAYTITFHITTWGGESYRRSLRLPVKNL